MRFFPNEPFDDNGAQHELWNALKLSLSERDAVAYYRYPVYSGRGSKRREPDVLLVHRQLGIWIFECKGARIGNIREIRGHEWQMEGWYEDSMTPVGQAEDQMFEVKTLVERDRLLRPLRIAFDYRVVLPRIARAEWQAAGFASCPAADGVVLVADDLGRAELRDHLHHHATENRMPTLDDEAWERLLAVFRGGPGEAEPVVGTGRRAVIAAVTSGHRFLDDEQHRVADAVPEGPQRIRGLAGTGKTVVLARRAARMHASHPDWDLAFVFFTRSLYATVREMITCAFHDLTREAPNWDKLRVMHAWGGKDQPGLYRQLALWWGCHPMTLDEARKRAPDRKGEEFDLVCSHLEGTVKSDLEFFDAILIDEGQDLPAPFYRLAHRSLRPPKRLAWAYDEAQGIGSLLVPRSVDIFGTDSTGAPLVELGARTGPTYPSGIAKAHNLNRCYRTPREILTVAHAINMGLLREGGPLQGVTTKADWESLGYEILAGDFTQASVSQGASVQVQRSLAASGHPVDTSEEMRARCGGELLHLEEARSWEHAAARVAECIEHDLADGLVPEDLLVIGLQQGALPLIATALQQHGVATIIAGKTTGVDEFRVPGKVTISGIHRAKGNEAWKVYVTGIETADPRISASSNDELIHRNQIFTAMTRTRLWCTLLGKPGPTLRELAAAAASMPTITFPAFNQRDLKRHIAENPDQGQLFPQEV